MDTRRLCWLLMIVRVFLVGSEQHYGNWTLSRQQRFIVWTDSGSMKLAASLTIPINLYDKKKWRSLNLTFNFQFQYNMVQKPTDWWDKFSWNIQRSDGRMLVQDEVVDLSATYLYAMMESYMNNKGRDGRQCMQRAICQNAQAMESVGLYERIYYRLMTPEDTMEDHYKFAFMEGKKGVDCFKTYRKCPAGHAIFDQFVQYN